MKKTLRVLISVCFLLFSFLSAVNICCFHEGFYRNEYARLQIAEDMQMPFEDLMEATKVLLDYTRGKREDMVVFAQVKNAKREVFNDREKAHMKDVRALYRNAMIVRNICLLIIIAGGLYLWITKDEPKNLAKAFLKTSLVVFAAFGALCLYAFSDFDTFWTNFHHVFFASNDLWLLDPRTDLLINMVPEQFFFDLIFFIVMTFAGFFLAALVLSVFTKGGRQNAERGLV